MSTYNILEAMSKNLMRNFAEAMSCIMQDMPDEEFDKIPIIEMTQLEKEQIEKYGYTWFPYRGKEYDESQRVFSYGCTPFKIKIKQ